MRKHIIQHRLCDEWKCIEYWTFDFVKNILPIFIQKAICCFTENFVAIEQVTEISLHSAELTKFELIQKFALFYLKFIYYLVILNVSLRSSVYKWVFPFFCLVLPVNLTCISGFSRVKLLMPCPRIGNTRIWPLME